MSILIKGMEMPTSCVECKFHKGFYCVLTDLCTNSAQGCPLVEIPAADVREVVTCGECKYADSFPPTCTEATFPLKCLSIRYGGVYPNWFCEHGERAQKTNCGADMREES